MRLAYRGYVKDLLGTAQNQLAEKYRQRLIILDAAAANDPSLRAGPASAKKSGPAVPASLAGQGNRSDRIAAMPPPATARGKIEDPFDVVYQRPAAGGDDKQKLAQTPVAQSPIAQSPVAQTQLAQTQLAQTLLAQAHTEFAQRRFAQARLYFEQAAQ